MSDESRHNQSKATADDQSFRSVCESIAEEFGPLLDSMPDGIIITDVSGRIVCANSPVEKLFGYGHGDLASKMIEKLVPACYREFHVDLQNSDITGPEPRPMGQDTLLGLRQDGSEFLAEISLSPIQTDVGLLIFACVRDVTNRAEATNALRASEEQVRLVLDSTAEAIYGLDLQGNCTFCNRACLEILGYESDEELLGQNMHNLIHHTRPDGSPSPMHEC